MFDLREQTQGERVLIEALEATTREVINRAGGIDSGKPVAEKSKGVFAGKRPEVKQEWCLAIVVLDLDAVGRAPPVGFAAGEYEGGTAHPGKLPQDGVDRTARGRGGDLVEPVDDDALALGDQCLGSFGAVERAGAAIPHAGLSTEGLGEDALADAGIAQDHDRLDDGGDVFLADDMPLLADVLVR